MAFESQPIGVLCAYFVNTQLAEWSPPELRKQQTKLHRHDWAQPQTHPDTLLSPSRWEATCTECLCKLRVLGVISDRTTTGGKAPCTDDLGHHFHTRLSDTPVSQIQGRSVYTGGAWCCKCNSQVELSLTAPVISSLQVAALERARAAGHEHHSTQAVREVLVTLKTMFRIAKNAVGGDVRPIKSTSPKPRQLLKFDTACNEILAAIGFVIRGDEFYPPDIVASISDDELKSSVSDSLSYQQLVAAMEELLVASGKFMRRLPPNDRDALFRYLNGAISLMQLLGSDMYPKRPGSSPLVISSNRSIIGTRSSLEEGYRRLGAPEDAADSLVAWAYLRQTEEDESDDPISGKDALERFDALQGIAAARSSKELGDLVANEEDRGLVATDALRAALGEICGDRMLEVDAIGVDSIRELFTAKLGGLGRKKDKLNLVSHLHILASAKRDQALKEYVVNVRSAVDAEEDVDEGSRMTSPTSQARRNVDLWTQLPTGLKNIGNTCYLNCMLQCLFSITPIRNAVLQFGDGKTWNEDAVAGRRDGSHVLSELEIRRALRFVRLLKDLFGKLMSQRIDNSSMSASGGGHPLAGTAAAVAPDRELADMLLLAGTNSTAKPANGSNTPTKPDQARSFVEQQDVDECIDQCISLLQHALPPDSPRKDSAGDVEKAEGSDKKKRKKEPETWIHRLLIGNLEYTNGRTSEGELQTTHELFHNLLVNIPSANSDINECLDGFFADDTVASSERDVVRQSRVSRAPPVLFVQVQRVQFDKTTMQPFKVNSHIRLREQISLARFCQFDGESADAKRCHQLRKRLSTVDSHLQALKVPTAKPAKEGWAAGDSVIPAIERAQSFLAGVSSWTANDITKQLLAELPHDPDLLETAKLASDQLTQMLTALNSAKQSWEAEHQRIHDELERIYADIPDNDMAYTLHAVFIHSGVSSEYGHYWVYIRDRNSRTGETRWVKFNDSSVSTVEASEILRSSPIHEEENANPYYLVYVQNQELPALVDLGSTS